MLNNTVSRIGGDAIVSVMLGSILRWTGKL